MADLSFEADFELVSAHNDFCHALVGWCDTLIPPPPSAKPTGAGLCAHGFRPEIRKGDGPSIIVMMKGSLPSPGSIATFLTPTARW